MQMTDRGNIPVRWKIIAVYIECEERPRLWKLILCGDDWEECSPFIVSWKTQRLKSYYYGPKIIHLLVPHGSVYYPCTLSTYVVYLSPQKSAAVAFYIIQPPFSL